MKSRKSQPSVSITPVLLSIVVGTSGLAPYSSFAGSGNCSGKAGANGMQQQYCDAGNASKKASSANKVAAGLYGAAGAVCGVACALEYTVYASAYARASCTIGSVGAGVGDYMQTKDFTGAVGSLFSAYTGKDDVITAYKQLTGPGSASGGAASAAGGSATSEGGLVTHALPEGGAITQTPIDAAGNATGPTTEVGAQGGQAAGGATHEPDGMICVSAALNVATAGMKVMSANKADKAAEKNFDSAAKVSNPNGQAPAFTGGATGGATGGTSSAGGTSASSSQSAMDNNGGGTDHCAAAQETGNLSSAVACAAASGASVPSIVKDPRFGEMLQKATGMNPSDFLKKAMDHPGQAVTAGIINGTGMSGDAAMKTAAAYAQLEKVGMNEEAGAYAGSGGGRRPAGGGDPDLNQMMAGIMGAFGSKKDGEDPKNAGNLLKFGGKLAERYPANVDQDRKVSLFDRVTHRYKMVSGRVMPAPLR